MESKDGQDHEGQLRHAPVTDSKGDIIISSALMRQILAQSKEMKEEGSHWVAIMKLTR